MSLLSLTSLTVRRGACPVVDDVSLTIGTGECVGLIGPNGAGKTTLMRAALGLLPHEGQSSLAALSAAERARAAAWMPQSREIAWPIAVEDIIRLGRMPHGTRLTPRDTQAVEAAISRMELDSFRARPATELSGGEQARVLIARALAQDTPLLMADEPTAGLDPAAQLGTLDVMRQIADEGRGVLLSLHDLSLAARSCTRLILLDKGRLRADGPPQEVLTEETLAEVFHLRARIHATPDGPLLQPLERL
ncbi:ABC transporter ATP-binding protein [Pacificoceanicola onchidii]|uniref:ABC transporter ATP-binding protein n=1 Tax=Pacificoceanicola onchidii TaxID=2562685 RepID=UPI0010A32042|nr:ABC transporter ATP-binding protein [Pacificoceanicola onchidii]